MVIVVVDGDDDWWWWSWLVIGNDGGECDDDRSAGDGDCDAPISPDGRFVAQTARFNKYYAQLRIMDPLCGGLNVTSALPTQICNNVESVSIWKRLHDKI